MGDDVDRVRRALPRLDRYVQSKARNTTDLEKESGELRGSNPWHGSSTGNNFAVDPDEGTWFCHSKGCKAGGGILEYIARDEGIVTSCDGVTDMTTVFPEVLEVAAEIAGLDLNMDARDKAEAKKRRQKREKLDAVFEAAAAYYHQHLNVAVPDDGGDAVSVSEWLHDKYGLDDETLDDAMVGFAPNNSTALVDKLDAHEKLLLEAGLAVDTQDGVVDFFDGRVVFPYFSRGKPRYFIGRKTPLTPDHDWEKGKYKKLQTAGTKDYVSELVEEPIYGRDHVRDAEHVIVTEGVTDVLAARQHGYTAIAPVTTGFKSDKVRDVARLVRDKTVTVIMDEDAETQAGIEGALKTAKTLDKRTGPATTVRVARLPLDDGDLCDYLREKTTEGGIVA